MPSPEPPADPDLPRLSCVVPASGYDAGQKRRNSSEPVVVDVIRHHGVGTAIRRVTPVERLGQPVEQFGIDLLEVSIDIDFYPGSDPARKEHFHTVGRANRLGLYVAPDRYVFKEPGEYFSRMEARYYDRDGRLCIWGAKGELIFSQDMTREIAVIAWQPHGMTLAVGDTGETVGTGPSTFEILSNDVDPDG